MLGVGRRGAIELAKSQIRVNTLAPGLTSTRLWENSRELGAAAEGGFESQTEESRKASQEKEKITDNQKDYIQQTSTPDDIANVMLFLASDMSQAVNAEYILVRFTPYASVERLKHTDLSACRRIEVNYNRVPCPGRMKLSVAA